MREIIRSRLMYWAVILVLLVWIAHLYEQNQRYEYADRFLRADIAALRNRVLGL